MLCRLFATRIRLKTYQWAGLLLLLILLPVLVLASQGASTDAAPTCRGNHTRKDFYQNVRYLEPSTILEIVGDRINYAVAGEGIELGSLNLEINWTVVPKDFATNHKGCFGIVYCQKHHVALQIDALDDKFCQLQKH